MSQPLASTFRGCRHQGQRSATVRQCAEKLRRIQCAILYTHSRPAKHKSSQRRRKPARLSGRLRSQIKRATLNFKPSSATWPRKQRERMGWQQGKGMDSRRGRGESSRSSSDRVSPSLRARTNPARLLPRRHVCYRHGWPIYSIPFAHISPASKNRLRRHKKNSNDEWTGDTTNTLSHASRASSSYTYMPASKAWRCVHVQNNAAHGRGGGGGCN